MAEKEFYGYRRPDGSVGVRNHVLIIPSTGCASALATRISNQVIGTMAVTHTEGCLQLGKDVEQTYRTLVGIGRNPNVAAVVAVGLGCEQVSADKLADDIAASGKPAESVIALELGGVTNAMSEGVKRARKLVEEVSEVRREKVDASELVVGVKCALTDTTSGIAANPSVGNAIDRVIEAGGTAIFSETPEIIGAEHILAKRAVSEEVANRLLEVVRVIEERVKMAGVDMRGSNPTPGNIKMGITTIEEKSLGAILKGGTTPLMGVLDYGERPPGKGLYFMDGPGRTNELLTGLVAAGAQVIVMPTGGGSPSGSPIAPTIKVTGNPNTSRRLMEYIDIDVSQILAGLETVEEAGARIYRRILRVASGEPTKIEKLGYGATAIYTLWTHL